MKPGPEKQFDPQVTLEAAMKVFWAYGYEAASLSELTKAMGINKQSLYNTFGNKRSLFLKALDLYAELNITAIHKRLLNDGSAFNNLVELLEDWKCEHAQPGSKGCMLGTSIADFNTEDVEIASHLRKKLKALESVFTETLEKAIANGEIASHLNPRQTAQMLICLTQGFALIGRIQENDLFLTSSVKAAVDYLTTNRKE